MPITPHFDIHQTLDDVMIDINVPHVRVSVDSVQVVLTDSNKCLHFASPPYLLILTFGQAFEDNAEDSCARYDPCGGKVTLRLRKQIPGVYWDDLDLVGALMKPSKSKSKSSTGTGSSNNNLKDFIRDITSTTDYINEPKKSTWIKEILQETAESSSSAVVETMEEEDQEEEDEGSGGQKSTSTHNNGKVGAGGGGYGFCRMFHGIFTDLARDGLAREMLEIPIDDCLLLDNRSMVDVLTEQQQQGGCNNTNKSRQRRQEMERTKFCPQRYLQDLDISDDYLYQCAMSMKPHWTNVNYNNNNNDYNSTSSSSYFTPEESAKLASIPYPLLPPQPQAAAATRTTPNATSLVVNDDDDRHHQHHQQHQQHRSSSNNNHLWLGILDLLFAYCYDHFLTDGDPTVESAWTISILSCSLSWLESFDDDDDDDPDGTTTTTVEDIIIQSIRRSLIYPYLRNIDFAIHIWKQISTFILQQQQQGISHGTSGGGEQQQQQQQQRSVSHYQQSRRCIIRCLLQIRNILDHSELYYLGNKLYIDPYLAWLQQPQEQNKTDDDSSNCLANLATQIDDALADPKRLKERIDLNLNKIERDALFEGIMEGDDDNDHHNNNGAASNSSSDSDDEDSDDEESNSSSDSDDGDGDDDDDDDDGSSSSESTVAVDIVVEEKQDTTPTSKKNDNAAGAGAGAIDPAEGAKTTRDDDVNVLLSNISCDDDEDNKSSTIENEKTQTKQQHSKDLMDVNFGGGNREGPGTTVPSLILDISRLSIEEHNNEQRTNKPAEAAAKTKLIEEL